DARTHHEIRSFLYKEARFLDAELLRCWYDLLADDLCYWAPLRENKFRREKTPELNRKASAMFDETKATIDLRLQRLESGMAWAEDPATRQLRVISNIECFLLEREECYEVHSTFALYRHRAERDDSTLFGRRRDIIRRTDQGFELAGRLVLLQQSTLLTKNLSAFF
ncbi:MAG: 3-phenylpropionate/cinnamic acid dioxygenase subunit beta, partial [Pseudomonadota bacterium]